MTRMAPLAQTLPSIPTKIMSLKITLLCLSALLAGAHAVSLAQRNSHWHKSVRSGTFSQ